MNTSHTYAIHVHILISCMLSIMHLHLSYVYHRYMPFIHIFLHALQIIYHVAHCTYTIIFLHSIHHVSFIIVILILYTCAYHKFFPYIMLYKHINPFMHCTYNFPVIPNIHLLSIGQYSKAPPIE